MRGTIRRWLGMAIDAVEPGRLTAEALSRKAPTTRTVIAIGKAAPAMCHGAAQALGDIEGLCVAAVPSEVPTGVELVVGDHPVPGEASLDAGRRALGIAREAGDGLIALISGGGSALCEWPRPGIDLAFLEETNRRLLTAGTSIEETNLVRAHLSQVKCGGLAQAAAGPVATYVLSDVAGAGPEVVASGPTLSMKPDPDRALAILESIGIVVNPDVSRAIRITPDAPADPWHLEVVGDGRTAAEAIVVNAKQTTTRAEVMSGWLAGEPAGALDMLFDTSAKGVTVATGETAPVVARHGRGGRNTHAALLAATRIAGTGMIFAAMATDGSDGAAGAAGAIVDGGTVDRGGDPWESLESFDSASYLERTGDLLMTGPTGTNVADLWLLWRP